MSYKTIKDYFADDPRAKMLIKSSKENFKQLKQQIKIETGHLRQRIYLILMGFKDWLEKDREPVKIMKKEYRYPKQVLKEWLMSENKPIVILG